MLIGGHYDHFGIGAPVDGDSIYNGAEDNASGTAAVLAAAEAFVRSGVRTARSLVFVGFAAEESGLIGSQALADNPPIPLRDIAAILNLDVDEPLRPDPRRLGPGPRSVLAGKGRSRQAAAAEGLKVTEQPGGADPRGPTSGRTTSRWPGWGFRERRWRTGRTYLGKPAGYGKEQKDEYVAKRYHQPSDEILAVVHL